MFIYSPLSDFFIHFQNVVSFLPTEIKSKEETEQYKLYCDISKEDNWSDFETWCLKTNHESVKEIITTESIFILKVKSEGELVDVFVQKEHVRKIKEFINKNYIPVDLWNYKEQQK